MSAAWITALLQRPPVIYGRRLHPFSLSHSMILEEARNPLWCGGEIRVDALIEAVDVCSRTWEENAEWFDKVNRRKIRSFSLRCLTRYRFADAYARFKVYIDDATACSSREVSGEGRLLVSPHQYRVVVFLMSLGWSESRAWNAPFGRARCYYDAHDEAHNGAILLDDAQEDAYSLIARGNELAEVGRTEQAAELYARAQEIFARKDKVEVKP